MNDVNKVAARKLRSLATAIRAEFYAPHEFGVREEMEVQAVRLTARADVLDPPLAEWESDLLSVDAYNKGVSDTVSALVARLQERRSGAIHPHFEYAYNEAIKMVEALR